MKFLLGSLILCMSCFNVIAQDNPSTILKKDATSKDYFYEEVVQTEGLSQEELFKRSKVWILANLKTTDNNISFDEKTFSSVNTGAIKIDPKSFFTVAIHDGAFDFKFHVWCKENRYKIRIDNIMYYVVYGHGGQQYSNSTYSYAELPTNQRGENLQAQGNTKLAAFIALFKDGMSKSAKEKKEDDKW